MGFINLSKLILLIKAVKACPKEIPGRNEKLFLQYLNFRKTSDDKVSVEIPPEFEKLVEIDIDSESEDINRQIVIFLIDSYSNSEFSFPDQLIDIYIVSPLNQCERCSGSLIFIRPYRLRGKGTIVYTMTGPQYAKVFIKHCSHCHATVHSCYTEWTDSGGVVRRKYLDSITTKVSYFSITQDSFFEVTLLEDLTESVFTCNSRFTRWVEKYNRLQQTSTKTKFANRHELYRQRVFPCWLIYSVTKRMPVEFPVFRGQDRNLNIEEVCCVLYPALKATIDAKWLNHTCQKCISRIVVMDGDQKIYRSVCAARGDKVIRVGKLNEFTACSASPLPGQKFCKIHEDDKAGNDVDRLDTCRITRAKRKELGLDIEELTTSEGCRKREAITVRTERSKTAGMTYCFRPCGISLGN